MRTAWALAIGLSAMPAFAQYAGPAILSRGDSPATMVSTQIDFRPFVDIAGVYVVGLSGLSTGSTGTTIGNTSSAGLLLSFGVSGTHSWKHTKVGLDYTGSITHYANAYTGGGYGNYDNQSFLLSVTRQFSPHTSFTMRESASVLSQPYAVPGLPETVTYDPASVYNPTTDFYNNRTIFLSSEAGLTFQKTARLSFSASGLYSLTERQGQVGLFSVTGAGANGDLQYRLTSHSTVGASYGYNHFEYHGTFNATDVHTLSGTYAIQPSRSLEITGYAGFSRSESKFLQSVPLSPVLSSLIGLRSGIVITHSALFHPTYNVRISRSFQRGIVYLSSAYSVTPGNGLFLASTALSTSAGYNYTGLKRWSFGATAVYLHAYSISNVIGSYGDVAGGLSVSRQIFRLAHLTFAFNATQYQSSSFNGYNRLTYAANLGIGIAPGNIPLRLW